MFKSYNLKYASAAGHGITAVKEKAGTTLGIHHASSASLETAEPPAAETPVIRKFKVTEIGQNFLTLPNEFHLQNLRFRSQNPVYCSL